MADHLMPADSPGAPAEGQLSIGALSRATGIPVETLRTWERRYHFPQPIRKPSGHRLYPLSAVVRLGRVAQALARGHRAAEVLPLAEPELETLLGMPVRPAAGDAPRGTDAAIPVEVGGAIQGLLEATVRLDPAGFTALLQAGWTRLGPLKFLAELAAPFMKQLGERWTAGSLDVRHEHFAASRMTDFLREVQAPFAERAAGPRVVLAMLPGDLHELGLRMAAVVFSVCGWQVLHLGADLPVQEIAAAARDAGATAVGVSVSPAMPLGRAAGALRALRTGLPAGVALWTGGSGAPGERVPGVEHFADLEALHRRLSAGGAAPQSG
jgi:MerR family transcriptional regulator, light-induced transcriptional regulator